MPWLRVCSVALLIVACGDETAPEALKVDATYVVTGSGRVFPNDAVPDRLQPLSLTISDLAVSGEAVTGRIARTGEATSYPISGTFDPATRELSFMTLQAVLTGTTSEQVEQLGGIIEDARPLDAVGDTIVGFIRTRVGRRTIEGRFVGISGAPRRPPAPDAGKITGTLETVGQVRLLAQDGAFEPRAGIEIFRYTLGRPDPDYTLQVANVTGGVDALVSGLADDLIVVRNYVGGVASEARTIIVTR